MDAPSKTRSVAPHRSLLRQEKPKVPGPSRLRSLAARAAWLGLASGLLELGVIVGHRLVKGDVTRISHRFNRDYVPMNLVAHLAIMGAWLILALIARRASRSKRGEWLLTFVALFLAVVSPLLALEEIYWPCSLVLAAGVAARLSGPWGRHQGAILRRTLAPLAIGSAVLGVACFASVHTAERRALAALPPAPSGSPNVVLLVLDTVRADHLSLYGYARDTTPNLRALASRSIVFDFARSPAPWTLPSHASMFTGRWPHELSVDVDRPLDGTDPTIAEALSARGYATGGFTANTVYTNAWFGIDRGFARYEDSYENSTVSLQETLRSAALLRILEPLAKKAGLIEETGRLARRKRADAIRRDALSWIDARGDRPFFVFMNFLDAHDPYVMPEGFAGAFCKKTPAEVMRANRLFFAAMKPGGDKGKAAEPTRDVIDVYDDCLRYMDDQVARLMADLKHRGRDRDTWIIVTADHGEHFGEHDHHGHGDSLYRPVIDVPLMVVPPVGSGVAPARVDEPVSPRDIAATIAEIAGPSPADAFPGRSLGRFWRDEADRTPDVPLSELKLPKEHFGAKKVEGRGLFNAALVSGGKIFHRPRTAPVELYDRSDRPEATNLAPRPDHAEELRKLRALGDRLIDGP